MIHEQLYLNIIYKLCQQGIKLRFSPRQSSLVTTAFSLEPGGETWRALLTHPVQNGVLPFTAYLELLRSGTFFQSSVSLRGSSP